MKQISRILLLLATVGLLAGCGGRGTTSSESGTSSNSENPTTSSSSESGSSDTSDEQPPEETYSLNVGVFGKYVDANGATTIETGFKAYLTAANKGDLKINFVRESAATSVAKFAEYVVQYNTEHTTNQFDVLLGLRGDANGNPLAEAGYTCIANTEFTYGVSNETDRRFWYNAESANIAVVNDLKDFLSKEYGPKNVVLNKTSESLKPGESVTVTASYNVVWPEVTVTAQADKTYATVQVEDANVTVTLSDAAVADETVTVTVSSGTLTPATLTVTVLAQDAVAEHHLVVALFKRYIHADVLANIENNFKAYAQTNNLDFTSMTFYEIGNNSSTTVAQFAEAVTTYNNEHDHDTNVLLGCNANTGSALSNAGYKALSSTAYSYGPEGTNQNNRKIYVLNGYDAEKDIEVTAFATYIAATYPVPTE